MTHAQFQTAATTNASDYPFTLSINDTSYSCQMLRWTGSNGKPGWSAICVDACYESSICDTEQEASDTAAAWLSLNADTQAYNQALVDDVLCGWFGDSCPLYPDEVAREVADARGTTHLLF